MLAPTALSILSPSPKATSDIAERLSSFLEPGDCVLLSGNLGAGKSLFARSIINTLTGEEDIPSPTYTLVQTYETSTFQIWHADLYRLSDEGEALELGLDHAMASDVCLIEWPDRIANPPRSALWVTFVAEDDDSARRMNFSSWSETWRERLEHLNGWWKDKALG